MKEAPIRLQTQLGLNSLTAHLEPPPKRMRLRSLRLALGAAIWAVLSLAGASRALATLPTLTVSPTTIANDYTGEIDLNITGLGSAGQTVIIEKYFDADGSNTINSGDILMAKYLVTDGQVTSIASQRNLNIPGDDDGAADGKILTKLHGDPQDTIGMLDGQFIFRVSPSGTGFTPFTATLVVTQKDYGGSGLSGTVSVSGTPQAGALVLISGTGSNKGPVGFTPADASGHFSIKVPPGSYQLWGVKHGFVYNVGAAPALAVSSGSFLSSQSIPLVASGRTISGTVSDSTAPHQPLPGVAVIGKSTDGMLSITFADGSGNFTVDATAGQWNLQTEPSLTTRLGFLKGQTSDSSSGNVTGFNFAVQRVTALIYGTVADSGANPVAGIQLSANDSSNNYDINATSDASGHYSLGVIAGSWNASISNNSPGLAGYVVPNGQSVTLTDAQAVQASFTLLAANAHLQGVVTKNGAPVSGGIQLSAYSQNTNQSVNGQTAPDGTFALGLAPGTWSLQIDSSSAVSLNVVSPSVNYTLSANQTLSGITLVLAPVTGQIAGTVKDGHNNPVVGVQVSGNATVAATNYSSSATTDSGGNFSVPVCAGTWNVGVSSDDLQSKGLLSPSNQNATVSTGTVTLNFIALSPTSTIHGTVKTPTGTPVPSVPVSARQMGGAGVQINGQTDASGNYTLGVSTGSWDVGPEFSAGYVPQRENVIINTDGSNVLQNLVDHPVTAHLRGQIRDNHNNPVGNLEILAVDNNFNNTNVSSTTDSSGNFDLAVYGGEGVGLTKQWTLQIPEGTSSTPSPYVSSVVSFDVHDSVDINNIAYVVYLITAHLRGQVLDENNAVVPNIAVGASNQSIAANTGSSVDASGNFDIPLFGGSWGLGLSLIQGLGLLQQNELISVTDGVDQNNLVIRARHATATIAGYVKDTQNNPVGGVQVFGNITVAGIDYSTSTSTDSGGNYSLPVFSGTWAVSVSGNDLQSRGYQPTADQNAFANTGTVTLNFTVSSGTIATLAATNITGTGATLNGSVNPGGLSTTVSFDYGLTNAYGSSIAAVPSPISGSGPTTVSAALTGLAPGTTYHYRVVASNTGGTNSGADMSFITSGGSATAPSITTQPTDQTVAPGQTATFTVVANSTVQLTYQWQKNGMPIDGATNPTLTLNNVQLADVGYYTVVVGSSAGNTTSSEAALTLPSFPIATSAQAEISIGGAFDGTNFLVAIQGDAANYTDISAQLVSQTGTLVGPRISVGRTGGMPWVAFDGTNYLLVWEDDATYPVNRLWGAFVSPGGALVGSAFAFPVRTGASTRQAPQGIAFDGANYLVTYTDNHDGGWPDLGGDYYNSSNLCARFVTPSGTVGDEMILATNAEQSKQTVAWNGSTYFVAWPAHIGGNQNIVQGRKVSTTGVMSSLITIDSAVSLDQNPLSVATDGTNFLVVWNYDGSVDLQNNAIWELRGRVVDPTGVLLGSQITVADTTTRPMFPGILFDGANYLVAWTAQHGPGNLDVAGCYFNSSGVPQGATFSIAVGSVNQGLPLLVAGAGKRLVGWTGGLGMSGGLTGGDVRGMFLQGPAMPAVTHFTVGKWVDYLQNSAAAPVTAVTLSDPAGNYGFSAEVSGSNLTSLSPAPGVTMPGGGTYALVFADGQWKYEASTHNFASQAALDAAFPNGTYTMNIGSLASNVSIGLSPDSYPNTPAVANGTWDASGNLLVNAGADSTINFNTFTNYANGGAVEFKVFTINSDGQGHTFPNQMVVNALNISAHSDPALTSYTILSGTLQPNQVYYAEISFDQLINVNTSAIPGAFGGADFARHTGFYISTATASGPVITQHPANQIVSTGQNATFTIAANGTPAPTLQWQVSTDGGANWSNLSNDTTSSGVTQATLTVVADFSLNGNQYRCVATNTTGPATSNAATLTVNTPPAQLAAMQFFGGAGDQRGTGITIVGSAIYVTGNAQPESQNPADSALLARYAIPFGGPPVWSRSFASGSLLYGVAASSTGLYGAGASYTLTTDAVGGKEDKTILAKFAPDGTNGTGTGGSAWVAGSGGTTSLSAFFAYGGVEMFRAAVANTEGGAPVVYAAGFGQPASYSACLVAKFDAAGNRLAATTDTGAGLSLGRVYIPSSGGSTANGVAVLGSSVYAAGSTGWAFEDVTSRPVVWIYNQSLALTLRQRDTTVSGGFNAITAAGGALYAAGFVSTPGVTGSENYLVQKFDAAGNRLWSATWGGQATDVLTGVVGVGNRLFVSGYTKSQGAGGFDGVLCEIDPRTGSLLSTVLIGGAQDDLANGVATDGTDLYVVGETRSSTSGGNTAGQNDGFVARYVLGGTTPAPTVLTTAATSITATGATLNGSVNANGAGTTVSFDYGLTAAYGSNIAAVPSPVTGTSATAVSAVLSGLLPSTTYHYRATGGSAGGAAKGADATFTTPSNVATLSKLVLSTGTLSPAFASATTNYSASVANGTPSIMVTPTVTQGQATVQVNGSTVVSTAASGAISLTAGGTLITVVVTAQDGTTTQTYTIAVFAPLIAVQQPAGTALVDGAASRDFGGIAPGRTGTLVFTVKNTGKAVLNSFGLTFDGANPGDFSVTTPPAASVAAGGSTTFTVTFTPGAPEVRTATLHLASNDLVHSPFDIALTGTGATMPSITTPPASLLTAVGQPASLTVITDGGASSYQWLKNNAVVPGATSSTYSPTAALTNAGAYTVKVTNAAGSVTSVAANLGVVNVTPATVTVINGNTVTLTAAAAGPNLTYQWVLNGSTNIQNGANPAQNSLGVISGATTPTLTITKAVPADANTYTCVVTMPDPQNSKTALNLSSGVFTVNVTAKPVLNTFTPGPWIVSGTVTDKVTAQNNPTSFAVTGLPTGVTVNPKTGQLGGKPLVNIHAETTYPLTVTATNAAGTSTPLKVNVTVDPLPDGVIGTFNGLVDRDDTLSLGYGGTFNISSVSTGTFTGKLTLGGSGYSFTAQQLDASMSGVVSATVVISRKPKSNLVIAFAIDLTSGELTGSVTDGVIDTPVPIDAWRNPWNATTNKSPLAGIYNSELTLDSSVTGTGSNPGNIVYPQGTSFGTLTVTSAGIATWSGKMADGATTTCFTTMGPNGEVPLHFMLYTNTGSAHGWVQATGNDPDLLLDTMGTFDWMKTKQTAATLSYKNGFALQNLTVVGAKYIKPTAGSPLVMGIGASSSSNAQLLFSEGGLLALSYVGPPAVSIAAAANITDLTNHSAILVTGTATSNSVSLPTPNPATITVTINAGTGAISGSFILHGDQDPTKSATTLINRTGTFSGLSITRDSGVAPFNQGVGYFLLPELQPYPGLPVGSAPVLSGKIVIQ